MYIVMNEQNPSNDRFMLCGQKIVRKLWLPLLNKTFTSVKVSGFGYSYFLKICWNKSFFDFQLSTWWYCYFYYGKLGNK